jgi:hypothetical protein
MRLEKFTALATHPYYGKFYQNLSKENLQWCENFASRPLNKDEFTIAVARAWLGETKPKHASIMADLLLAAR